MAEDLRYYRVHVLESIFLLYAADAEAAASRGKYRAQTEVVELDEDTGEDVVDVRM